MQKLIVTRKQQPGAEAAFAPLELIEATTGCRSHTEGRPANRVSLDLDIDWEIFRLAKLAKPSVLPQATVRTRRAYFDFKHGQLHVRTAFPGTGGFDEQVTLICLHSREGSSRSFTRFLPEIAADRSVYAPDLPGFGESDPAPSVTFAEGARAVLDLTGDLRLRQMDVLGVGFGAAVALELAAREPDLVRRLVLVGAPPMDRIPSVKQPSLVMRGKTDSTGADWNPGVLPAARIAELPGAATDPFNADAAALAKQISAFLNH
jgi:pimeloyl-ACP methyl ester carboxylesterase